MAQLKDTIVSGSLRVTDTILGTTLSVSGTSTLTGNVGIGASPESGTGAHLLYVNGTTKLNNTVDINGNLVPTSGKTLGTTSSRWSALYVGSANSYGDAYTPVYWNTGVPAAVTPLQRIAFTIASGKTGVKLAHAAFTTKSYVTQIVVDTGAANLNNVINWSSDTAGEISLTTTATSGDVSGYILVSRGDALTATATAIT